MNTHMTGLGGNDLLYIEEDLVPQIDHALDELLNKGKKEKTMILDAAEHPDAHNKKPHAVTEIKITFKDEDNLRKCVRLLRWSDERLRERPDLLIRWAWNNTYREGMVISFGVTWFDEEFFNKRKDAFKEARHQSFYAKFGADASDFEMHHKLP